MRRHPEPEIKLPSDFYAESGAQRPEPGSAIAMAPEAHAAAHLVDADAFAGSHHTQVQIEAAHLCSECLKAVSRRRAIPQRLTCREL